jgi:hypothetical protein
MVERLASREISEHEFVAWTARHISSLRLESDSATRRSSGESV